MPCPAFYSKTREQSWATNACRADVLLVPVVHKILMVMSGVGVDVVVEHENRVALEQRAGHHSGDDRRQRRQR
jgi:hypothetical protein